MVDGSNRDAVQAVYPRLSPTLKRAADYVLEHPDEVAHQSLRSTAREADLTPTTFSRLARALELKSFDTLRQMCRADLRRRHTLFADKALSLVGEAEGDSPFLFRQAAAVSANTQRLLEQTDIDRLEKSAEQLAGSSRVLVVGAMSGASFAAYATYLAGMALKNWHCIDWEKPDAAAALADMGKEDTILTMTFEPYAARTVGFTRAAKDLGAHIIALTDTVASPIADVADDLFLVSTDSPQFFTSHVAVLVLLESLVGMAARKAGQAAQKRIAAVERRNHVLGEYWRE